MNIWIISTSYRETRFRRNCCFWALRNLGKSNSTQLLILRSTRGYKKVGVTHHLGQIWMWPQNTSWSGMNKALSGCCFPENFVLYLKFLLTSKYPKIEMIRPHFWVIWDGQDFLITIFAMLEHHTFRFKSQISWKIFSDSTLSSLDMCMLNSKKVHCSGPTIFPRGGSI